MQQIIKCGLKLNVTHEEDKLHLTRLIFLSGTI